MKNNRHGQAAIISESEYVKIRAQLRSKKYKLLLDIARFTGERWGAIVQLKIEDIFDADRNPLAEITFPAGIRKADTKGKRHTRSCPVHPALGEILSAYRPSASNGWLFESRICPGTHITLRAADLLFRGAVEAANLAHKGFSTHSTRRTFITRLWEAGVDLHTIQLLTGHKDPKALIRYIEADPNRITKALALL
ncbi:MAG: tyrosine-type recombinase/integrase [Chroococcus sp. CMT-3BRIN-NPC107]|nr:tyrosine-type recombinase/integrase [Chroococcus sp. CMT-3BRIN-NPC107]